MATLPPLLAVDGLAMSRGDAPIYADVSFCVDAGRALLVKGANGSGKTSLLRQIAGLAEGAGSVRIGGEIVPAVDRGAWVALVGHRPGLKAELSCQENLRFANALVGVEIHVDCEPWLAEVGLSGRAESLAGTLSAGQLRRLGLAALARTQRLIWLLDEPYVNLDLAGIDLLNALVDRQLARGGAAVIASHGAYATPTRCNAVLQLHD